MPWKIPLGANPNSVCSVSRPRMKVLRKLLTNHMTCMNVCDCLNPFVICIIIFGIHSYSLQKSTSLSNSIIYCPKLDLLFAWLNCCRSEKDSFFCFLNLVENCQSLLLLLLLLLFLLEYAIITALTVPVTDNKLLCKKIPKWFFLSLQNWVQDNNINGQQPTRCRFN